MDRDCTIMKMYKDMLYKCKKKRSVAVSEEQQMGTAVHGVIPIGESSLMGESCTARPKTPDPRMSCVSPMPSHACCCYLSLVSGTVWTGVGRSPSPVVEHVYLMEASYPTGYSYL